MKSKDPVETTRRLLVEILKQVQDDKDEDIVHALSNEWVNMNKVSLAEAGDGSPPFWSYGHFCDSLPFSSGKKEQSADLIQVQSHD